MSIFPSQLTRRTPDEEATWQRLLTKQATPDMTGEEVFETDLDRVKEYEKQKLAAIQALTYF
jgi:uncharacterized protein (DUF885 family)